MDKLRFTISISGGACKTINDFNRSLRSRNFVDAANERAGFEKMVPVPGSFWSNLKFFKMMFLTARLCEIVKKGVVAFEH